MLDCAVSHGDRELHLSVPEGPWLYTGLDIETIRTLLDTAIRRFIDLTQDGQLDSDEKFLREGSRGVELEISYSQFPIRSGYDPDRDLMEQILDAIVGAHSAGGSPTFTAGAASGAPGLLFDPAQ